MAKKKKTYGSKGKAFIKSTYNNTIITITDETGDVVGQASGGAIGYKGTKKSTPFAGQLAAEKVAKKAMELGIRTIDVKVKGPGPGKEAAIRALESAGLVINSIQDTTPVPHNGCRPSGRRRV